MSNSSGVEFIDENATEDTSTSLYQLKKFPTKKVPKIISLIEKIGVPAKYAENVAFGIVTIVLAVSLYGLYDNLVPKKYTLTKEQKDMLIRIHPGIRVR